jgi:hypothetical protein
MTHFKDINTKVLDRVFKALKSFLDSDGLLLGVNASERSISHKLAEHMQREFTEWDVDCEYNRRGERTKTLPRILFNGIKGDDQEAKTIFPDIIIHKRKLDDNLLVIEVKKSNSRESEDNDIKKLTAFTDQEGDYKYKVGLFIVFDVENQNICNVKCFEHGRKVALPLPYWTN